MYKVKIEFKTSEVRYYKLLNFSDVVKMVADNAEATKINIWYKEPNMEKK